MHLSDEIHRLATRRQDIWFGRAPGESGEVSRLTLQLADLYEERRSEDARFRSGERAEIVRRARVETELERLMTS